MSNDKVAATFHPGDGIPDPERRGGIHVCVEGVTSVDGSTVIACGRRFIFHSSYQRHWLEDHAADHLPILRIPASTGLDYAAEWDRHPRLAFVPLTIPVPPIEWDDDALVDLIVDRARTVPGWALGPQCEHPHHLAHNLMCVVLEDARHLPRKDQP